ncbi:MAG: hypothetical protein QXS24_02490 [Desulfurococcaceae archaeon]
MSITECVKKEDKLYCNELGVLDIEQGTIKFSFNDETNVLFIHELNEIILCTGLDFQVYVWGKTKYTLWTLRPGNSSCIVLKDLFLDECTEHVYAVSSFPNMCDKLNYTECEDELITEMKLALNMPLFILVGLRDDLQHRNTINIVNHEDPASCQQKLTMLASMVEGREK